MTFEEDEAAPPEEDPGMEMEPEPGGEPEPTGEPEPGEPEPGEIDLGADPTADPASLKVESSGDPVSWEDIVVVVRKPFLKVRRLELLPTWGITMNDNIIRHVQFAGAINYFLTDVLAVGIEGQYYVKDLREPYDLVARQARRLPTVNKYNYGAALNFHYVPVYGKFAILDKRIVTWEVQFVAGIGAGQSEVIPRDTKFPGFTNFLIQPNVGAGMRFFLAKWLTINAGIRDYIFIDKFEPTNREVGMNDTAQAAKEAADSAFINNVMFQIGISFWLPTSFEYTTFR
ncbi:MAG TPA: outer membrane beta-barrel domain-containing protein [Kofleriaceae bacterium]|nr:outer membrane beta-barrel domain-containing protein [Kofleriaceae bacterium]